MPASVSDAFKPTSIEKISYKAVCKPEWKGKTVFIDFDVNRTWWGFGYGSTLAYSIRDKLMEDVVEDGCFKVQDKKTGQKYAYKIGITIGNPVVDVSNNVINNVSGEFRIKTYDHADDLITAKSRDVAWKRPFFVIAINDSQQQLLKDYSYNASVSIRQTFYESLK